MIVLSEDSPCREPTPSAIENRAATEAAKLLGFQVYYIPADADTSENVENGMAHIPAQEQETPGAWIGYIPSPERYRAVYEAAWQRRIRLLNAPAEHLVAQEFDRSYPKLEGLTPESVVITDPWQCARAIEVLGLPVFVKGTVQSRKTRGWKACVAETRDELQVRPDSC